jgi:ATP-dependent helicase/nuclease subunit A
MSDIKFTADQLLAIDTEGCDILVSAAAGSGKTAVLTQRVLKKITDTSRKTDITDFLVVTFTVSAANDLKRKLSEGIRKEMKRKGADTTRLRRQLLSLSYAKIATIDSFCLFIVKDCLRELGLPVGMTMGDENEMKALALELMEETVEEFYSSSDTDEGFLLLAEAFSNARGDAALIPNLIDLYTHLLNFPCPETLLEENITLLKDILTLKGKKSIFSSPVFAPLKSDIRERLEQVCQFLEEAKKLCELDEDAYEKYLPLIEKEGEFAHDLLEASDDSYERFYNTVNTCSFERIPQIRGRSDDELLVKIKDLRSISKGIVTDLRDEYRVATEEEIFSQLDRHIKVLDAMSRVLSVFHTRFSEEKKSRKIMSFSDVTHYAFSALVEKGSFSRATGKFRKTPYAESLTSRFSEILIDEYQDVNELQDLIFRAISNSHNRFMVGDIKQSIYAFRGATPKIFEHYRDTFREHTDINDTSSQPKTVFLKNNYRSDSGIINFSNYLFSRLMNHETKKYLEQDMLVQSRSGDKKLPVELVIFDSKSEREEQDETLEAEYIANKILSLVQSGEYKFEDIAILARARQTLAAIKDSLDKRNIPADTAGGKKFFESYEILSLLSFLKAINNPTDDVCLVTAMTTLPFDFSPDELYKIRGFAKKCDYYFALVSASEDKGELGQKCLEFIKFIDAIRDFSEEYSCDRVVWKIIEELSLFSVIKKLDDPSARRENIISFYELSRAFCRGEKKSLGALCDYFDTLAKSEDSKTQNKTVPGSVKLMTFHASKGLQFPVCFAAGLGRLINKRDSFNKIVHSDFGPTFDLPWKEACTQLVSYLKKSAASTVRHNLIDEELRTLYVTFTRPETKLFVTAQANVQALKSTAFASSITQKSFAYCVKRATTPITLIAAALSDNDAFIKAINAEGAKTEASSNDLSVTVVREFKDENSGIYTPSEKDNKVNAAFTKEQIAFAMKQIHHSKAGELPYKISVSDIKEGLLDEGREERTVDFISAPDFLSPAKSPSPAFIGTSMHTFMQFCSFDISGREECQREAERLLRDGFITKEHFDCLDFDKLAKLFDSELLKKIQKSPRVEREKRYTLLINAERVLEDSDAREDDTLLLQGVIDCYFENDCGGITLVDFKTDRVKEEGGEKILLERHSEQLRLYAQALSEILPLSVNKIFIYSFALDRAIEIE